ncbi:hypothetical protein Bca101_051441 [Brassica carinata]|uniref:Uncharacterized protein n=2 Tax=Brassica oleracea TaxID=3712 RepID=A0A0D3AW29_BRAOL|nr:unnamed protein product [Brassica oleracea]
MNNLIIFMLVIVMCFGFKESSGCPPNTLQFKNQVAPDRTISVGCTSNRDEGKGITYVKFNDIYSFPVVESSRRIVWKCRITDQKNRNFVMLWRAYRGAYNARCGQIREYIADPKGLSLVRNKKPTKEFFPWMVSK